MTIGLSPARQCFPLAWTSSDKLPRRPRPPHFFPRHLPPNPPRGSSKRLPVSRKPANFRLPSADGFSPSADGFSLSRSLRPQVRLQFGRPERQTAWQHHRVRQAVRESAKFEPVMILVFSTSSVAGDAISVAAPRTSGSVAALRRGYGRCSRRFDLAGACFHKPHYRVGGQCLPASAEMRVIRKVNIRFPGDDRSP